MGTPVVVYFENPASELWWCRTHKRWAEFMRSIAYKTIMEYADAVHCCDPRLGGITMPCNAIEVTDVVKAVREEEGRNG